MLDNYAEETRPLFKLLRTEAFRFVLVHFNHYSLIYRLKEDLRERFPSRVVAEADAGEVSYRQLADKYYHLERGIFLIDNFESVLDEPEKYNGLNLHRDKLAQYPIAMICFISPGAQALSAREIMEKMPDLWSFRSFMLDLKREVETGSASSSGNSNTATETKISSLGGYTYNDKLAELERLYTEISKVAPGETSLLQTIYSQVKTIQEDVGFYAEALKTIDILKTYTPDKEGLAELFFQEGDLLTTIGKSKDALNAFNTAMSLYSEYPETNRNYLALINERLGSMYMSLGDIEQANHFFTKYQVLEKELFKAYPDNPAFKNNLAISYEKLGNTQSALGNLDKALSHYEQYNQLEEQLHQAYPDNVAFKNNLAVSYQYLGNIQSSLGNSDKALSHYEQDIKISIELHQAYPDNAKLKNGLAVSYSKLGKIQSELGNLDKALFYYEQDIKLSNELHQAYPDNVGFKNGLAVSFTKLGSLYKNNLNNKEKAKGYFAKAAQLWEELVVSSPEYKEFQNNLQWTKNVLKEV